MDGHATELPKIPDKLYFKVGEVSALVGVPTYVLRFWESEFTMIRPKRTAAGQRLYRRRDIEFIFLIKSLLYEKRFTIEGARQHLKTAPRGDRQVRRSISHEEIRQELLSIRKMLS